MVTNAFSPTHARIAGGGGGDGGGGGGPWCRGDHEPPAHNVILVRVLCVSTGIKFILIYDWHLNRPRARTLVNSMQHEWYHTAQPGEAGLVLSVATITPANGSVAHIYPAFGPVKGKDV